MDVIGLGGDLGHRAKRGGGGEAPSEPALVLCLPHPLGARPPAPLASRGTSRAARPPCLAGAASCLGRLPSRTRPSRWGASRKSRADRLGGVSTTIRSHSSARRSWPSFSIAMYSCVPAKLDDSDW